MNKIQVFISSTCYDLSQIRKDLKDGIEEMGHQPILSENKDFPVNPALNTFENCIDAVRNNADIFVLIIGGHYGYALDSGKSITNTEFLTAIEKGIPIYTFTLKSIINVLPVWRKNPKADFSAVVDDNRVFEFVNEVREKSGIWNFEFESEQDIIEILKAQWSFLFKQALISYERVNKVDNALATKISNKALKYLLDKGDSYEMLVFLQMMQDEIDKYKYLKNDCKHYILINPGHFLSETGSYFGWQQEKLRQLEKIVSSLNCLFDAFRVYFGEPGVPSDIDGLYYIARRYGELYRSILDWVIDVRSTNTNEEFIEITQILSSIPLDIVEQLESYPAEAISKVQDALRAVKMGKTLSGTTLELALHVSINDEVLSKFNKAMNTLHNNIIKKVL